MSLYSTSPRPWYEDGELAALARARHPRRHESPMRWAEWVNVRDHVRLDAMAGAVYPADVLDLARLEFISLFAGIGGMDLGLERAGLRCAAQVEIDDYATRVLAKHWPAVARFRDVRHVGAHNLPRADLICGGFPCQDISSAGKRAGLAGERSGLWAEFARIIRELRPRYVLVENTTGLLSPIRHNGRVVAPAPIGRVLGDLAALGYDAEWECIPAAAVGAPHFRDRVFILATARLLVNAGGNATRPVQDGAQGPLGGWVSRSGGRLTHDRRAWADQSGFSRVAHGIPARVDRLRGTGNAVVPQVAEFWGRAIEAHAYGAPAVAAQHKEAA